jgi:beta-phosphoglucomutase-like phosphatase (HAD superfamily)
MPRLDAVIFDMDGLMLDTETMLKPCFQSATAEIGCVVDDQLYDSLIGLGAAETFAVLQTTFGDSFRPDAIRDRIRILWAERVKTGIPRKDGLDEVLDLVESYRIPTAVATSTEAEEAEMSLRTAGLWGRFNALVTGDQVRQGKPAPDIYLEAASRLGVEPHRCVALEDSSPGVLAAHRSGMRVLMIPDRCAPSHEALAVARVFPSLRDASAVLSGWLGRA